MPARLLDCSTSEYFADPGEVPTLSYSVAKQILKSPRHAWAAHPRLGARPAGDSSEELDTGTLVHSMLLDGGRSVRVLDVKDYRTAAAKAQRDAARAAGLTPVKADRYDELVELVDGVRAELSARGITLSAGRSEVKIEWSRPGGPLCRCMVDWLNGPGILDFKTIASADVEAARRQCYALGYDVQAAAYTEAVEELWPTLAGRVTFTWVFVELDPLVVVVRRPDAEFRELGRQRWDRAVRTWAECLRTGSWPGYPDGELSPPTWAMKDEVGRE